MKAITIFSTQYGLLNSYEDKFRTCDATDYVFVPEVYTASNNATTQSNAINKLLSLKPSAKIWIGTPGINSTNFSQTIALSSITGYVKSVYDNISNKAQVSGVYINQEAIYGDVDYTNLINGTLAGNKQIKRFKEIKDYVKASTMNGRNMLWIPYYGYGSNAAKIIKDIGYVADSVQIFDYVCMQPHYFFDPTASTGNLNGVKYSVEGNAVKYRDGVKVIASKVSTTQIGYEMEYDPYKPNAETLYGEYVSTFSSLKSKPTVFYWAGSDSSGITKSFDKINSFY